MYVLDKKEMMWMSLVIEAKVSWVSWHCNREYFHRYHWNIRMFKICSLRRWGNMMQGGGAVRVVVEAASLVQGRGRR